MKKLILALILGISLIIACKSGDSNKPVNETSASKQDGHPDTANVILNLDTSTLKTEDHFYAAWENFTSARQADENKRNNDKSYEGHYLEYMKMYTKLLTATTNF